jgi:hypothetical protein
VVEADFLAMANVKENKMELDAKTSASIALMKAARLLLKELPHEGNIADAVIAIDAEIERIGNSGEEFFLKEEYPALTMITKRLCDKMGLDHAEAAKILTLAKDKLDLAEQEAGKISEGRLIGIVTSIIAKTLNPSDRFFGSYVEENPILTETIGVIFEKILRKT